LLALGPQALFESQQRLLGDERISGMLRGTRPLSGWRLWRSLRRALREWRALPKDKERGTEACAAEAFFESQPHVLGQERGWIATFCAIDRRTDQRAVIFRGRRINRTRHVHRLRK
jgi:hypothetical protein